ncbi:calcium-binding protein [Arenibaculum pallidiluteum]|uniref:hypothetical protein n=1 Tax=Arenibaculum pallidiluteum TaxID=2812559 RepID=UPI001A97170B|nr:hypothetical protein [Arenibaculum pallidiluteum]
MIVLPQPTTPATTTKWPFRDGRPHGSLLFVVMVSGASLANAQDATADGGRGRDMHDRGNDNDLLLGQAGDDTLRGGNAAYVLIGGHGPDLFVVSGDEIVDSNALEGDRVRSAVSSYDVGE